MKRDGISLARGTFSLTAVWLSYQLAAILWGVLALAYFTYTGLLQGNAAQLLCTAGFALNVFLTACLAGLMFSPRFARLVAWLAMRRGRKPHESSAQASHRAGTMRALRPIAEYRRHTQVLAHNPRMIAKMTMTSALQLGMFYAIPWLCTRALGALPPSGLIATSSAGSLADVSSNAFAVALAMLLAQSLLFISVSSLPLPGGAGVTEGGFLIVYQSLIPASVIGSAVILSRLMSFVLPLAFGSLLLLGTYLREQIHIKRALRLVHIK